MKEIYNFMNSGEPKLFNGLAIFFFCLFLFFVVAAIIHLIVSISMRNIKLGDYITVFIALLLLCVFTGTGMSGYNQDKQYYQKCLSLWENESYSVAKGQIQDFSYLTRDIENDYNITFRVGSRSFEWDEFRFGDCEFSEEEVKLLKNCSSIEVKYADFENCSIILSISVSMDNQ